MVRNSLATSSPQPVSQPQINQTKPTQSRETLNSTLGEENPEQQLVEAYLRSMRKFRVKPGKPEWSEDQKMRVSFLSDAASRKSNGRPKTSG